MDSQKFNSLLRLIDKGEESALKLIYYDYQGLIKWAAFRYVKNWNYVDDILNRVLINIWNKSKKYINIENPEGLIYEITRKVSLDYYKVYIKKQKRNQVSNGESYLQVLRNYDNDIDFLIMISSLEDIDQEIIIKKVLLNYTHQEIAAELKMPLGTVLWRYQKALKALLDEINKQNHNADTKNQNKE